MTSRRKPGSSAFTLARAARYGDGRPSGSPSLAPGSGSRASSPCIVFGPKESALADAVSAWWHARGLPAPRSVAPRTVRVLGALFERMDAVVTNNTGPMHVAAAVGAPGVFIHGPTPVGRWQPPGEIVGPRLRVRRTLPPVRFAALPHGPPPVHGSRHGRAGARRPRRAPRGRPCEEAPLTGRPLSVLHVLESPSWTGAMAQTFALCTGLVRRGHRVTLVTTPGSILETTRPRCRARRRPGRPPLRAQPSRHRATRRAHPHAVRGRRSRAPCPRALARAHRGGAHAATVRALAARVVPPEGQRREPAQVPLAGRHADRRGFPGRQGRARGLRGETGAESRSSTAGPTRRCIARAATANA